MRIGQSDRICVSALRQLSVEYRLLIPSGIILLAIISSPTVAQAQTQAIAPPVTETINQVRTIPTYEPTLAPTITPLVDDKTIDTTQGDLAITSDKWSWTNFAENFLSSVLSSLILAVALYVAITRPREKRSLRQRKLQLLGLLESELTTNLQRAKRIVELLKPIEDADSKPLLEKVRTGRFKDLTAEEARALRNQLPRYTRGVWNLLKEEGNFITQIDDTQLIYHLLRTNEALTVAQDSRIKLRNKLLEKDTEGVSRSLCK